MLKAFQEGTNTYPVGAGVTTVNMEQKNSPSPEQPKPTETNASNSFLKAWRGRLIDFGPYAGYAAAGAYAVSRDNYLVASLMGIAGVGTLVQDILHRRKMKKKAGEDYYKR